MNLRYMMPLAAMLAASPALADPPRPPHQVYGAICGYCHGHNVGPIILGRHLPAAYVETMVRHGRNGMPAFRPTEVSPAELRDLAQWIASAPANPAESGQ